ncbi:DNA repair helicase XPB [Deinococcus aquiradiocola]|uniref:DNA repair helicase XPB n=1 Tax=Deinococcus aquiradiocola TaxID=393059 RepID=UPI001E4B6DE4|nr:DNA repair helicase XPB [Deinococcus aquiradiocola]
MTFDPANPLIVQADRSVFLEAFNPRAEDARRDLAAFAELVSSPEHLHTYRITPLSLWNAAAAGVSAEQMVAALERHAKFPVPQNVLHDLRELTLRWGRLRLVAHDGGLLLVVDAPDAPLLTELSRNRAVAPLLGDRMGDAVFAVPLVNRGVVKTALLEAGWPLDDQAGYSDGLQYAFTLSSALRVREYQQQAAEAFYRGGSAEGGSGVVVLAPGSGKTVVGMVAMTLVGQRTLVLTTNRTSVAQWERELLARTTLTPDEVGEYEPGRPLKPVTVCTYQMLTHRRRGTERDDKDAYPHMGLIGAAEWGLIVYDEVHLLPAPVFRITAEVQARRRLGLTATLVREDGREGDVFALIGPKRYDRPWKTLEQEGFIAQAECVEVRLPLPQAERVSYAAAPDREKHRIAAENPDKRAVVSALLREHAGVPTLIIGQYLDQLTLIAQDQEAPLITGKTPQRERERLFQAFRERRVGLIVMSKVGNFALDLPDAEVLVQVSGAFGSRQEEAQRLGRLLRPKADGGGATFYSVVTRETTEEDHAHHRQLFLAEQGYAYRIVDGEGLLAGEGLPVSGVTA